MLQVEPTSHSGPVAIKSGRNISEAEKNLMAIGGGGAYRFIATEELTAEGSRRRVWVWPTNTGSVAIGVQNTGNRWYP